MKLCADDYGLNSEVSEGILNLLQKNKINSVSCLTTTKNWQEQAKDLKAFLNKVEIGLHLSLTHPKPIYFPSSSLKQFIKKAYLGHLKKEDLVKEIKAQIKAFSLQLGTRPNYIDGHEFCHHFPIIRSALRDVAKDFHFKKKNIYIRVFNPGKVPFFKNPIFYTFNHLASLPSKKLIKLLKSENLSFNERLLGFHPYCLEPKKYFNYYFQMKPTKKDIFFCHPGLLSQDSSDKLRFYRFKIYKFMMSEEFDKITSYYKLTV
ncbi:MAG: ChbG/HpnK family deacetylase [Bdellovibrionales bacterium]|nr:ChbG/HpnK family deacetylase [Bdellovibrionales bacterium]